MKKSLFSLLLSSVLWIVTGVCFGQTITHSWKATANNSNWNDETNWDSGIVPTSSSNVKIGTSNFSPTLSGNVTINHLYLEYSSSGIAIGSHTLTVSHSVLSYGSLIRSSGGRVASPEVGAFLGNTVQGNITLAFDKGKMNGSNIFEDELTLQVNSLDDFLVAATSPDRYKGHTTFINNGTGGLFLGAYADTGAAPTTFEKRFSFINNAGSTSYFAENNNGASVLFKGEVILQDNTNDHNSTLRVWRSSFEQSVTLTTKAASIEFKSGVSLAGQVYLNATGGRCGFIGDVFSNTSTVLQSTGSIAIGSSGFSGGTIVFDRFAYQSSSDLNLLLGDGNTHTSVQTAIQSTALASFGGKVNWRADYIELNGSTFQSDAAFERTGPNVGMGYGWNGGGNSSGGNTFEGSVVATNHSGTAWKWATSTPDVFKGNVTFRHGRGDGSQLFIAQTGAHLFEGNLILQSTTDALSSGGITIGHAGDTTKLDNGKNLITDDFAKGKITFIRFYQLGTDNAQRIELPTTATVCLENTVFDSELTLSAGQFLLTGSTFKKPSTFIKTNEEADAQVNDNTFYDWVNFDNRSLVAAILFNILDNELIKEGVTGSSVLSRLDPTLSLAIDIDRNPVKIVLKAGFEVKANARYSAIISEGASSSVSQSSPFAKLIPPSPEAASLGRFGEIPVSLQNGTIAPEIPLYQIQSGDIVVPIALKNHASGVRVNDLASSVGTGWALEAGGMISRTVRGLADESTGGLLNQNIPFDENSTAFQCYVGQVAFGYTDGESDVFNYSMAGQAGQYMYGSRFAPPQQFVHAAPIAATFPYRPLDIQWDKADQIIIKTEEGTTYTFGRSGQQAATDLTYSELSAPVTTAWHLLDIVSANRTDAVNFEYETANAFSDARLFSTQLVRTTAGTQVVDFRYQYQAYNFPTLAKYLKTITFKNGKVTFDYATDRQDVETPAGARRLIRVNIWAKNAQDGYDLTKYYDLTHGYFNCADGYTQSEYPGSAGSGVHAPTNWRRQRLRLEAVTEHTPAGSSLPPFTFSYYEDQPLPIYGAYAQDYWGFSNGATANRNLLLWDSPNSTILPDLQYGANRSPNFAHTLSGTLKTITYPTQGKSEFEFEAATKPDGAQTLQGGGIRIKRIINYDNAGNPTRKEYSYPQSYFTSNLYSGSFAALDFHNRFTHTFEVQGNDCCQNVIRETKTYPENLNFSIGTNSGSSLAYTEVEERSVDGSGAAIGKRMLKYRMAQDQTPSLFPFYQVVNTWQRGDLLEESIFKTNAQSQFVLLQKTVNNYHLHQENLDVFNVPARITFTPRIAVCSAGGQQTCFLTYAPLCIDNPQITIAHQFTYFPFSQVPGRYFMDESTTTQYDDEGSNPIVQSTQYEYGETTHHQLTKKTFLDSRNQTVEMVYRYPHEKASLGNDYFRMVSRHIYTPLIEEEMHVGGQFQQLTRTNYQGWYPVLFLSQPLFYAPYSVETQLAGGPLTLQYVMGESLSNPTQTGYNIAARPVVYTERNGLTTTFNWYFGGGKTDLLQQKTTVNLFDTYDYQLLAGSALSQLRNQRNTGLNFEYDGFWRLTTLRNEQNQLLKSHTYTYATGLNTYNTVAARAARIETTDPAAIVDAPNAQVVLNHFDGLGRPVQTVGYKASPTQQDIIQQHLKYDPYGRVKQQVLPVATTGNATTAWADPTSTAVSFYNDARPFEENTYEASPLNRPSQQYGAGNAWFSNNKFVQHQYGTSSSTRRFDLTGTGIAKNGTYRHIITKTTTDEQGAKTIEYYDVQGRMVQKDVEESTGVFLQTAYVYDNLNRLKYVIQPELFAWFDNNTNLNESDAIFKNGAFAYDYDNQGRLMAKHVPSGGITEMVYDRYDRVVWQRTALQQQQGIGPSPRWSFMKYDALNRLIMSGEASNTSDRVSLQAAADGSTQGHHEERNTISPVYYTLSNSYPTVAESDLRTISYFDDYQNWLPSDMAFDAANAYHSQYNSAVGLSTGAKIRHSENQNWLTSANYYDHKGRMIQTFQHNLYGQTERTDMEYNFAGEVLKSREAKKNQAGTLTTKTKTYQYDHTGRKTSYQLQLGNISNETIANYEYDEIGRMKRKVLLPNGTFKTAGPKDYIIRPNPDGTVNQSNQQDIAKKAVILEPTTDIQAVTLNSYLATIDPNAAGGIPINGLQKIDYQYHVRGWLRGINLDNSTNPMPQSSEGDLFAYKLDYETGTPAPAGFYDGNISKQSWHNGATERNYTFTYDNAKRLKSATYTGVNGENYSIPNMNYDRNGNITNLQRNGKTGSSFGQIDNLSYSYNGNRLVQITDAVSSNNTVDFVPRGSGDYTYYNDGSLKSDANEQISNILYDSYLQQPIEVQLTDGRKINHYYDGSGKLIKTIYSNGETWAFADGFLYKNDTLYQVQDDEGRILYQNGVFHYEFHYTDHLGNTRVSFKANGNQLEKVAEVSFDPWGVILKDLGQKNATQNRFEFLNREKESTFGLNIIRLGERGYNPTNGRFDRVDSKPDVAGQESLTTYQYGWNNPVLRSDPNGDCPDCPEETPFLIARLAATAFYDTKHAIANTAFRLIGSDLRADYRVEKGSQVFETSYTRQTPDNSLTGVVKETVRTVADIGIVATGGSSGGPTGALLSRTNGSQLTRVAKYEVGLFDDLKSRSVPNDGLQIHHAPQKQPAGQIIPNYDKKQGPSIALPDAEHRLIPTLKGTNTAGTPRQQLAKDIRDLRTFTNTPNSSLQLLIDLNKKQYPMVFIKPPRSTP